MISHESQQHGSVRPRQLLSKCPQSSHVEACKAIGIDYKAYKRNEGGLFPSAQNGFRILMSGAWCQV